MKKSVLAEMVKTLERKREFVEMFPGILRVVTTILAARIAGVTAIQIENESTLLTDFLIREGIVRFQDRDGTNDISRTRLFCECYAVIRVDWGRKLNIVSTTQAFNDVAWDAHSMYLEAIRDLRVKYRRFLT